MERVMSVEEKIRRAEEIYNRRNGNTNYPYKNEDIERKKYSLTHKMIKQMIICTAIYCIFYCVNNKEYLLSEDFQVKVQELANKNEYTSKTYSYIYPYIEKYINKNSDEENNAEDDKNQDENMTESNNNQEENTTQNSQNQGDEELNKQALDNNENTDGNIGGSNEEENQATEMTQEQKDVEDIKGTISFINPIEGKISSTFGWRTPTSANVPKYHTGLDIAASTGTVIKSATDGIVTLVSSEGDYGKHYKISIGDVTIIYAHCSKLYLNEGDTVYQGQEIAEVGSTGNSTGPHLHFEIRKEDRYVDPQSILNI